MNKRIKFFLDFKSMTFRKKLIIAFVLISIIPALLVGLLSLSISNGIIINLKSEMVEKEFANDVDKISSILKDIDDVSVSLFSNDYIQDSLNTNSPINEIKTSEFYNRVNAISSSILNSRKYISSISIFGKNGLRYNSQAYTTIAYNDYTTCKSYLDKNGIKGLNTWYGSEKFRIFSGVSYNIMNIKIIRNINSLEELGIMILSIDEKYLRSISDNQSISFLADEKGNIISDINENRINMSIANEGYFKKIEQSTKNTDSVLQDQNGQKVLISYAKIKSVNWYLVNIIQYSTILGASSRIRIFTILISIICLIVSFIAAFAISKSMTSTLLCLKGLMNKVEQGQLDVIFYKRNNDEVNFLGESFNSMVKNIKENIYQIKLKEKLKRDADLKLMQAQINPHMLYNTLDSMQWCLADGDVKRAKQINMALSTFFKISLSKGNMLIKVKQEIEHVKSYIDIQNICFNKNFTCIVDIEIPVFDYWIIKMTLQPLVENSIVHGLRNYIDNSVIKIYSEEDEDCNFILIVEDSGMGMTDEQVEDLNRYMESEHIQEGSKAFGMRNVNSRIKHFFGNDYGILIESEFGSYTKVKVKLPKNISSQVTDSGEMKDV